MSTETPGDERKRGSEGGIREVLRFRIELWVVVLFMALAFGAGVIVTAMYREPQQPVASFQQQTGQLPVAPPLSDQQLQGGLPPDHPDIAGATGAGVSGPAGGASAKGDAPTSDAGA